MESTKLKYEDLVFLNELLKTGLSFKNSLELLTNKTNEKIIDEIINKMDVGVSVEEVMDIYVPKNIGVYLIPLSKKMSFSKGLDLSLSFIEKEKEYTKSLMGSFLYPFILLFLSLSALYIFDAYGLDTILNMLKSFNEDFGNVGAFRIILRIIIYIFYILLVMVLALALYFFRNRNITLFYVLICKYLPNSIVQKYFCVEFVSLLNICLNNGYKSKESIDILKSLHNKPITAFLAYHLDERLLEGETLKQASKQAYYDYSLSKFINIAIHSNDFSKILNDYVNLSTKQIKTKMKKTAGIIQFVTYCVIGIVIIFVYQILFLPMNALANF